MNEDQITHIRTISWGMVIGGGNFVSELIEETKLEVQESLRKIGFEVTSQVFESECEWGRLITRAKSIPETMTVIKNGEKINYGKF